MELRNLSTFLTVAKTLSFTRAAEELNYAQSSVTAQIQALEHELGSLLFERLGKRVVLTESGRRLLCYAEKMVSLEREALSAVPEGTEPMGTLTVGACEWLCADLVPRVLLSFRSRFPKVALSIRPAACTDLRAAVSAGTLDLAFLADARVRSPEIASEAVSRESLIVIAPADHRLAGRRRVRPEELVGETFLVRHIGCNDVKSLFDAMAAVGGGPGPQLHFGSAEAIKRCVEAGLGLAISTRTAARAELEQGRVVELRCTIPEFQHYIQLIRHRDKWLSPALGAFIEVAKREIAASAADPMRRTA